VNVEASKKLDNLYRHGAAGAEDEAGRILAAAGGVTYSTRDSKRGLHWIDFYV